MHNFFHWKFIQLFMHMFILYGFEEEWSKEWSTHTLSDMWWNALTLYNSLVWVWVWEKKKSAMKVNILSLFIMLSKVTVFAKNNIRRHAYNGKSYPFVSLRHSTKCLLYPFMSALRWKYQTPKIGSAASFDIVKAAGFEKKTWCFILALSIKSWNNLEKI